MDVGVSVLQFPQQEFSTIAPIPLPRPSRLPVLDFVAFYKLQHLHQ